MTPSDSTQSGEKDYEITIMIIMTMTMIIIITPGIFTFWK